ncbi:MAG TPA: CoA transferase, partial [Accumulibacter sp.]|uniref:CoA transferase n=1 Tax=Accumulibacter sp. TaxID=2053492 RepID=UPI002C1730DE
ETADGHWFYPWLFNEEIDWRRFVIALGLHAVADDARFATREGRARDAQALIGAIERRVREHDWAHWSRTLAEAGVELISVATLDDVLCDPQVEHNAMLVPLLGTGTIATRTVSSPLMVHGHPKRPAGSAPALGHPRRAGGRSGTRAQPSALMRPINARSVASACSLST